MKLKRWGIEFKHKTRRIRGIIGEKYDDGPALYRKKTDALVSAQEWDKVGTSFVHRVVPVWITTEEPK